MDLRAEPIVISVPAVDPKLYYSVQLTDASTYNYGSRATGSDAGSYMVVAPGWTGDTPTGIKKVFRPGSTLSLAIFRTQLFNPGDIDGVKVVQAGYKAQPLSAFLNQPAPPASPALDFPAFTPELAKTDVFEFLDFALQLVPRAGAFRRRHGPGFRGLLYERDRLWGNRADFLWCGCRSQQSDYRHAGLGCYRRPHPSACTGSATLSA